MQTSPIFSRFRLFVFIVLIFATDHAFSETITIDEYIARTVGNQIGDAISKYREVMKKAGDATIEIGRARYDFQKELDRGLLGTPAEQRFMQLLDAKDVYYLSIFVTEGYASSRERIRSQIARRGGNVLESPDWDTALGARIDSGIHVDGPFDAWVEAVRTELGATKNGQTVFVGDETRFRNAIIHSSRQYDIYRAARNLGEINDWRVQRRVKIKPVGSADLVDSYMKYVWQPVVDRSIAAMAPSDREQALTKVRPWLEGIRAAIQRYEDHRVTAQEVANLMREGKYPESVIDDFLSKWSKVTEAMTSDQALSTLAAAYEAEINANDVRRGARLNPKSNPAMIENLKGDLKGRINGVYKYFIDEERAPAPIKLIIDKRTDYRFEYAGLREMLLRGSLSYEPPLPQFQIVQSELTSDTNVSARPIQQDIQQRAADLIKKNASSSAPHVASGIEPSFDNKKILEIDNSKNAPARKLDGPFGPEAIGLRLGMDLSQAERVVRAHMPVAVIAEQVHDWNARSIFNRRLLSKSDASERVVLFSLSSLPARLAGVSVYFAVEGSVDPSAFEKSMVRIYGMPTEGKGTELRWSENREALMKRECRALATPMQGTGFEYTLGSVPGISADQMMADSSATLAAFQFSDQEHLDAVANCPTTRWAYGFNAQNGVPSKIIVGLSDGGWVISVINKSDATKNEDKIGRVEDQLRLR